MTVRRISAFLTVVALATMLSSTLRGQVGKGIADLNSMPEAALSALPGMTPAVAKAFVAKRPFASITEANAFLLGQKLTQEQANAFYGKAFVHINLNTATAQEILLVPGAGKRMATSSRNTGRGRPTRSSTRRSASTWARRRPRSWRSTRSFRSA